MADITKANEQICAWQKNVEKLKNGEFGKLSTKEMYKTLLLYWQAQAKEGYPFAEENAKYFFDRTRAEEAKYERISKRAMAGVKPVILHIKCKEMCNDFFKRCEFCELEKELLNRLADLEDKIERGQLIEVGIYERNTF